MSVSRIPLSPDSASQALPAMQVVADASHHPIAGDAHAWTIRQGRFDSGLSAGVDVIELNNGRLTVSILPTRGMGIWNAAYDGLVLGWQSPVARPVHPQFVDLHSRNGLGWVDGFNELVCRCGLASNGPPGRDDGARSPLESQLTLHGKVANIPAHSVEAFFDPDTKTLGAVGVVDETAVFGPQLQMRSTISAQLGSSAFTIRDEITNLASSPTEFQLLYHTNIGQPFLEEGGTVECPASEIIPRDDTAAAGVETYAQYGGPVAGFAEQVFYYLPLANSAGESLALLKSRTGERGVSLRFNTRQLPCFSVWKCTQAVQDGYVTGLEPATNFPNFKAVERRHGRVLQLAPGQTYLSEVTIEIHSDARRTSQVSDEIRQLQGSTPPQVRPRPLAPYCATEST